MKLESLIIESLPVDRIEDAAYLAASALASSVSYESIFSGAGDEEWRIKTLTRLLAINIRIIFAKDPAACYYAHEQNESQILCFFMLVHSDVASAVGLYDLLVNGGLSVPFIVGLNVMNRMMVTDSNTNKTKHYLTRDFNGYIELSRMAVDPTCHRRGIGSYCLQKALDLRRKEISNLPVILKTQTEANVSFYRKR